MTVNEVSELVWLAELRRQAAEVRLAKAIAQVRALEAELSLFEKSQQQLGQQTEWALMALRNGLEAYQANRVQALKQDIAAWRESVQAAETSLKQAIVSEAFLAQ